MSETFYGEFYGFRNAPFHITPDASLLFLTAAYEGAIGAIEYGIKAGKGFIVVSGEVGVGKTTMLRLCLDRVDPAKTKIIYLFSAALTPTELYGTILDEFDPSLRVFMEPGDVLRTLLRKLLEAHQAGVQVVLAVDEAQNMPEKTLESLRILSNLETTKTKLLQIILVGQPELDALLKKHSLRQLAQRVAVRARLKRLTFNESCRYIQHRTRASAQSRSLFTKPAQCYIAIAARGIPRTINICCDNALINGYGHSAKRISLGIAREACSSLQYRSPLKRIVAAAGVLLVLIFGALYGPALLSHVRGAPVAETHTDTNAAGGIAQKAATATPTPATAASAVTAAPVAGGAQAHPAPVPAAPARPSRPVPPDPGIHAPVRTAASASGATSGASTRLRWVVRTGDTVFKACLDTYGSCDTRTLRAVLADNPQIGSGRNIRRGDVLLMPESIGWLRARPH